MRNSEASQLLEPHLSETALEKLGRLRQQLIGGSSEWLMTHLASIPRRFRGPGISDQAALIHGVMIHLGSIREQDAAAALLLLSEGSPLAPSENGQSHPATEFGANLYFSGDALERRIILRTLSFLNQPELSRLLLVESHRTNDQTLFEAGVCDTDLPAKVLSDKDYQNAILKAAFVGIAPFRLWGAETRATSVLSQMLLDLRTEREAANRTPWTGTLPLMAYAPVPALNEFVARDLSSPDRQARKAAAIAASTLGDRMPTQVIAAAIETEECPEIRALLGATD